MIAWAGVWNARRRNRCKPAGVLGAILIENHALLGLEIIQDSFCVDLNQPVVERHGFIVGLGEFLVMRGRQCQGIGMGLKGSSGDRECQLTILCIEKGLNPTVVISNVGNGI